MAWKQVDQTDRRALIRQLGPLFFLFLFVGVLAYLGYQIHLSISKIRDQATKKLDSHNITLSKSGMSVGVRHINNESYVDATQRVVVGVWNQRVATAKPEERRRFWSRSGKDSM